MTKNPLREAGNCKLTAEQEQLLRLGWAIQRAGSYQAFIRQFDDDFGIARETGEFARRCQLALRSWLIQEFLTKPLGEDSKWYRLADRPVAFTKTLDRVFSRFSRFFKQTYRISPHRPTTESTRDDKIWEMRQAGKTFGHIAERLDLSPKAAERAFKRREARIRNQTDVVLDMLRETLAETGFPFDKTVPSSNHVM